MMEISVTVNGTAYRREIEPRLLLIHFLRDELRLTGSHWGCDTSNCGVCVVQLDGQPVKSCTVLAVMADGHEVRTVEGLARGAELDPNPDPSDAEVRVAISGQICRCTGYENIVRSVQWAAAKEASVRNAADASSTSPSGGSAAPRTDRTMVA